MKKKQKGATIIWIIIAAVLIFVFIKYVLPRVVDLSKTPGEQMATEILTPEEILTNKAKYNNQRVEVKGRVTLERVVCSKADCPVEDKCCGCPEQRNLVIKDEAKPLGSEDKGLLRLLDLKNQPFCQRRPDSCDYDCADWIDDGIYEVEGTFFAELPPAGLNIAFNYFLQVENKKFAQKTGSFDFIKNVFNDAVQKLKNWATSGSYVLD